MHFLAPLDDLAVIRIEGADAATFLHSQLSNDIATMGPADARLAAYCNPKGRMLGSLIVWGENEDADSPLMALAKADILEPLLKRLRMFVLRAKVRFEITGLKVWGANLPAPAGEPWTVQRDHGVTRISAPAAPGGPAWWWVIADEGLDATTLAGTPDIPRNDAATWRAQDIEAGLGWVELRNIELFIPQSLAYDLIGGVNFTKGCYPGQEVVARAHYRGTVKRRPMPGLCHVAGDARLEAGADIFNATRPGAPAGRIINAVAGPAATNGEHPWHLLMEVNLGDLEQAEYRAFSADGPAIQLLRPPYPLEAG